MHSLFLAALLMAGNSPMTPLRSQDHTPAVAEAAQEAQNRESPSEIRARQLMQLELAKRPQQKDALRRNRALWAAMDVSSYRYAVSTEGAWGFDTGTILVTVRNGTTASVEYLRRPTHLRPDVVPDASPKPIPAPETPYTDVPALFAAIERALEEPAKVMSVTYNGKYGFPVSISAHEAGVSDSWGETIVGNFEILQ